MKLLPECSPCLEKQIRNLTGLIGLKEDQAQQVLGRLRDHLERKSDSLSAPEITAEIYTLIHRTFFPDVDLFDPYRELKKTTNEMAMEHYDRMCRLVAEAPSPLKMAVKVAAAGNIIDFGVKHHQDVNIEDEVEGIGQLEFGIFDYPSFEETVKTARSILYIGDNAGEIVFDKVLIKTIANVNPSVEIVFAVRHRPIINDATMTDAMAVNMGEYATVISSGSVVPGTLLEETSTTFRKYFDAADMVIAKGQGNFETLSEVDKDPVYFLLRIKCEVVAGNIGSDKGSLVLWKHELKRERDFSKRARACPETPEGPIRRTG